MHRLLVSSILHLRTHTVVVSSAFTSVHTSSLFFYNVFVLITFNDSRKKKDSQLCATGIIMMLINEMGQPVNYSSVLNTFSFLSLSVCVL